MDETPPVKKTGKKKRNPARRLAGEANVVALFGTSTPVIEPPDDPDQVRPVNPTLGTDEARFAPRKRVRMGKRMSEIYMRVAAGEITMREVVALMDPEELARGQLKAKDGTFRGAPPKWVPSEFHGECIRELLKRGQELYRSNFLVAVEVFTEIAANKDLEPKDRLKAAQYVWERVEGKVPDKVEVGGMTQPWEAIIGGIVAEAEDEAIARATHVLNGPSPDTGE